MKSTEQRVVSLEDTGPNASSGGAQGSMYRDEKRHIGYGSDGVTLPRCADPLQTATAAKMCLPPTASAKHLQAALPEPSSTTATSSLLIV